MVNKFREDLRKKIKSYFINHETWNTPRFKFSDDGISMDIFGRVDLVTKGHVYSTVKYFSSKAEFGIEDRVKRVGEDYYLAKDYMKYKKVLPLLIKERGWGWYEPTYEELDMDQQKRLTHHKKALRFSEKRDVRIEKMKDIHTDVLVMENDEDANRT